MTTCELIKWKIQQSLIITEKLNKIKYVWQQLTTTTEVQVGS